MRINKKEQERIFDEVAFEVINENSGNKQKLLNDLGVKDNLNYISKINKYIRALEKGSRIIDVGCGTGSIINQIYNRNNYHIIGVDISSESIKVAKQKNRDVDFIVCDIDFLPLKNSTFDMVMITNVLHHLSSADTLKNITQLLSHDGIIIIDDIIKRNPLYEILTFAYLFIPFSFKMKLREMGNHIDSSGHLPNRIRRSPKTYKKLLLKEFEIIESEYHSFFFLLSFIRYLSVFYPKILNYLSVHFFQKLDLLDRSKLLNWSAISMTIVARKIHDVKR